MRTMFNILTKNLRVAEGLVYVHQYNAGSWQQELQFICGDQDLLQWQVGHCTVGDDVQPGQMSISGQKPS